MRGRVTIRPLSVRLLLRRVGLLLAVSLLRSITLLLAVALVTVCAVGFTFNKFNRVTDNFRYPLFLSLRIVIRPYLDSALHKQPVSFCQTVTRKFCCLAPEHNRDKVCFSLPLLVQKRPIHRQGECADYFL